MLWILNIFAWYQYNIFHIHAIQYLNFTALTSYFFWQSSIFSDFPIIRKIPNYVFYIVPKNSSLITCILDNDHACMRSIQIHCDKGSAISWAKIVASLRRSLKAFGEWREWTVHNCSLFLPVLSLLDRCLYFLFGIIMGKAEPHSRLVHSSKLLMHQRCTTVPPVSVEISHPS